MEEGGRGEGGKREEGDKIEGIPSTRVFGGVPTYRLLLAIYVLVCTCVIITSPLLIILL